MIVVSLRMMEGSVWKILSISVVILIISVDKTHIQVYTKITDPTRTEGIKHREVFGIFWLYIHVEKKALEYKIYIRYKSCISTNTPKCYRWGLESHPLYDQFSFLNEQVHEVQTEHQDQETLSCYHLLRGA